MTESIKNGIKLLVVTVGGFVLGALLPAVAGASRGFVEGVCIAFTSYGTLLVPLRGLLIGSMLMVWDGGDWWHLTAAIGGLGCFLYHLWSTRIKQLLGTWSRLFLGFFVVSSQ